MEILQDIKVQLQSRIFMRFKLNLVDHFFCVPDGLFICSANLSFPTQGPGLPARFYTPAVAEFHWLIVHFMASSFKLLLARDTPSWAFSSVKLSLHAQEWHT